MGGVDPALQIFVSQDGRTEWLQRKHQCSHTTSIGQQSNECFDVEHVDYILIV